MTRRILILALLALLALPIPTYAHDRSWDDGPPKGVVGQDGIACEYTASYAGHSYHAVEYIGADAGMMASDPSRERAWQESECRKYAYEGGIRFFLWHENMAVDASMLDVTVKIRRL